MCIVAFAWRVLNHTPLFLISNRDEFYHRPTQGLAYQTDLDIFAGHDLQSGGTWLGVTQSGRWAIITNYRDARDKRVFATSRGHIVQHYLQSHLSPIQFAQQLAQDDYAGFNLILGHQHQAVYMSNRGVAPYILESGIYVISNGLMSDKWAKTDYLRQRFIQELFPLLQQNHKLNDTILNKGWDILQDAHQQHDLPHTGVSLALEKLLSPIFIQSADYGTRCSNILLMTNQSIDWFEKIQQGSNAGTMNTISFDLKT